MPLPSYLISASLLVCEKVLHEKDGVTSAIRIVDIFPVPPQLPLPPGMVLPPEILNIPMVQAYALLQVRAEAGHQEEHTLEFKIIKTGGEIATVAEAKARFQSQIEGAPGGLTVNAQLNIAVKRFGTCILCVHMDGEEIARTPFTLIQQKPDVGQVI